MKKLLCILACLLFTSSAFAGVYRWVDEDGRTHYTNNLSSVPPDFRNEDDLTKMKDRVETNQRNLQWAPKASRILPKKPVWQAPTTDRWGKTKENYADEERARKNKRYGRQFGTLGY